MKAPDALIFDLDGTLWDTNATCARAWNRVIERLGIRYRTIETAEIRAIAGRPHLDAVRSVFSDLDEPLIERICRETEREDNLAVAEEGGHLYPGVLDVVPRLRERVPLMIVSNCQSGYIEAFLSYSGLGPYFVDRECWGNTRATKGDNLAAVIARNGTKRPLFVGDTEGDRAAAREAGARFAYAAYGFGIVETYDHRVDRFEQVAALLEA